MDSIKYLTDEDELFMEVQEYRQHIHMFPEIALKEFKTCEFITARLKEFGFDEVYSGVGGTGVVAILRGRLDESILLRADIDALSLTEKAAVPYASTIPGMMHACGHDAHAAMLLGVAKTMITRVKDGLRLNRGIKFCFQPGEENTNNGAGKMISDKTLHDVLDGSPRVKQCFAIHLANNIPVGKIHYKTGAVSSNSNRFQIDIIGKGGHASTPENTIDAVQIGINVASQIYQIRGRTVKQTVPSAVSIGEFKGGYAPNIISDTCQITGSVRTVTDDDLELIMGRMKDICDGHQTIHKAQVTFQYFPGQKIVVNDASMEQFMIKALSRAGEIINPGTGLGGEDFYNFSTARPSTYFAIGSALPGASKDGEPMYPHHSPIFQIDESCFLVGVKAWLSILQDWLE